MGYPGRKSGLTLSGQDDIRNVISHGVDCLVRSDLQKHDTGSGAAQNKEKDDAAQATASGTNNSPYPPPPGPYVSSYEVLPRVHGHALGV